MSPSPRPLAVQGSLRVSSPGGETVAVHGRGHHLHVEVPGFGAARRLARALPRGPRAYLPLAERHGLSVEIAIGRWMTARWEPGQRPGPLARLFGWAPLRLAFGARRAPAGAVS